jgi:uncharacterized repeat protein (TIGR03803 family)
MTAESRAGRRGGNVRKLTWGMRACGVVLMWATAAVALLAQTTAVAPNMTFTTLFTFDETDGYNPDGTLVQGTDGKFYGTTFYGGATDSCSYGYGCGTVFSITTGGTLATIYNFCSQTNCADGEFPGGGWSKARMGTSTDQREMVDPAMPAHLALYMAVARSSKSLQAAP